MPELIHDVALCIIAAWLLGILAHAIRQPVLLAYLVGGFVLGPAAFRIVTDPVAIAEVAHLGLIFLLFMIGLEIDLKKIVSAGRSITVTALVQIVGGAVLGVVVFRLAGLPLGTDGRWDALYLGVAAACSSTVIIVKLLYDKRELDTLAGRITLGILVLQDVFSILFLAVQPNLEHLRVAIVIGSFARVTLLVATALVVSRFVLPPVFRRVARLPELVLVGALAWCFLLAEFAAALSLSREMGALVAGVALSTFPYALDVTAKVTSLRDFFITLFFVGLGLQLPVPTWAVVGLAGSIAAFTVVSRLLMTFTPLYLMKTGLRISALPAIHLCQISEFSLVILALGLVSGHISTETSGAVSFAFVILAVLSCLAVANSDPLVRRVIPWLERCGLRDLGDESQVASGHSTSHHHAAPDILLLGFFRTASSLLEELSQHALLPKVAVVDFNPVVYEGLRERGVKVIYGDISQRDTLQHAGVASARVLVCTVPESLLKGTTNDRLVRQLRELNPKARIIVTTEVLADVEGLRAAGADYISVPRLDEAADLCDAIVAARAGLIEQKQAKLDVLLRGRQEILP